MRFQKNRIKVNAMQLCKTVTFGVIAYNEQKYLPSLLDDLLAQTYPKKYIEVVLVDGESSDYTKKIMFDFKALYESDFSRIVVLENEKKVQPAGWNIVLKNAKADVILRIDAHAKIDKDFIENNMRCLNSGEFVCGGPRENIIDEDTGWKRVLLEAEQSMFGSGIAVFRQDSKRRTYVKSVFHAAYRKEVIDRVGEFNEELIRTEDNEYHYRVRQAGYNICYDPLIKSKYQTRNSLGRMIRQKYQNGFWIGKTIFICPECISTYHLVPLLFVCGIILTSVMTIAGIKWPMVVLWGAYLLANITMAMSAIYNSKMKNCEQICLPFIFLALHIAYGVGTLLGMANGLFGAIHGVNKTKKGN